MNRWLRHPILSWQTRAAYRRARRDHPAGKGAFTVKGLDEGAEFTWTAPGTDSNTRAAVDVDIDDTTLPTILNKVQQAAADAYRQGVEDAEQSMLYSIAYLPDNVDARDFVNKLIENRRRRGDRPGPDMGRWDRR